MDFKKQAWINSIGSVVLMFAQWLISVLLVRMGGYEDAGVFSLAMSMSNVFSFFANYGIRNYQIADIEGKYLPQQYLSARFVTSLISFVGCAMYLAVSGGYTAEERIAIFLYLVYSNLNVISDCIMGAIQIKGHLEINGYSNSIRGIVCFAVYIGVYLLSHDLLVALGGMVVATALVLFLYDVPLYRKMIGKWRGKNKSGAIKEILCACFSLMLSQILPIITTALPRRTIQLKLGTELLGYFSSVFTPTVLLTTMIPAIVIGFVPQMATYWQQHNIRAFVHMNVVCYGGVAMALTGAELVAILFGRPIMSFVFGIEILEYFSLLLWAILATGLNAMTMCGNAILTAVHSNSAVAFSAAVALLVVWGGGDIFVDKFGIYGAAYSLTVGYGIQVAIQIGTIVYKICRDPKQAN